MNKRPFNRPWALVAGLAAVMLVTGSAAAHGPDPLLSGPLWNQDQVVFYQWKTGQAPPAWMTTAIDAAAADASLTRASRAATFARPAGGATSVIAYGEPTGCSAAGIACFDRSAAPSSFRMWFRAHGYVFDWGALRWCQGLATIANGCFDVENVALDEFGHVEILGHHVNNTDNSDYTDALVQTIARARPDTGWNAHAFGRCDTARLQLEYDRRTPRDLFSTCLAISTTTALTASASTIGTGDAIIFSASVRSSSSTANRALASDPLSARTVLLQRRLVGTTSWTTAGAMAGNATVDGTYALSVSPTATYEWRATFTPVAADGALGSSSGTIKVTLGGCTGPTCPSLSVP